MPWWLKPEHFTLPTLKFETNYNTGISDIVKNGLSLYHKVLKYVGKKSSKKI